MNYQYNYPKLDPIFMEPKYDVLDNPNDISGDSLFVQVWHEKTRIKYIIANYRSIEEDKELLKKIRRYILLHEMCKVKNNDLVNTYFIGESNKTLELSKDFINQNVILITLDMIVQWYPKGIDDIIQTVVGYLISKMSNYGEVVSLGSLSDDVLFIDKPLESVQKRQYLEFLMNGLVNKGYVRQIDGGFGPLYTFYLTPKAVSECEYNFGVTDNKTNKAFIAIKFDGNNVRINTIQDAISQAGFEPVVMNRLETNNWIMPEVFHQIEISRFVVADFSLPCEGAYYEAGYAAALQKPVIHLFDEREKTENNKLHFDIAQKSTIYYEDWNDLKERLINRIKATIK